MAVLEVPLLSGFRVDMESLEQVRQRQLSGAGRGSLAGSPSRIANSQPFVK